MQFTKIVTGMVLAGFVVLPSFALAETWTVDSTAPESKTATAVATRTPQLNSHEVMSPRDHASGMATGRMGTGTNPIGTGTKILPKGVKTLLEHREEMRNNTASGSPKMNGRDMENIPGDVIKHRGDMLKHAGEMILLRIKAAIERFSKLADRIDSRIVKLKQNGIDTSMTETLLVTARAKIAEAKQASLDAELSLQHAISSADNINATGTVIATSTLASSTKPVRDQIKKAEIALKIAHKALVDTVASLKGLSSTEGAENGIGPRPNGQTRSLNATGTASTTTPNGTL